MPVNSILMQSDKTELLKYLQPAFHQETGNNNINLTFFKIMILLIGKTDNVSSLVKKSLSEPLKGHYNTYCTLHRALIS